MVVLEPGAVGRTGGTDVETWVFVEADAWALGGGAVVLDALAAATVELGSSALAPLLLGLGAGANSVDGRGLSSFGAATDTELAGFGSVTLGVPLDTAISAHATIAPTANASGPIHIAGERRSGGLDADVATGSFAVMGAGGGSITSDGGSTTGVFSVGAGLGSLSSGMDSSGIEGKRTRML